MQPVSAFSFIALVFMASLPSAHAQTPPNQGCIEVKVGQYTAPDYHCLSQQMGNVQGAAAQRKNQAAMNPGVEQRRPNSLGLATPAATSVRMGNTFGRSVIPQRPPSAD
ncbi:hypothetical protein NLO98_15140 [Pseudomonas syringae]|nr:hypothetical protein [Pseudomonas syringae]MDG6398974.1 hypothetical protein [Pseudomonas quasicaspiana]